jgi:adenylate kinase
VGSASSGVTGGRSLHRALIFLGPPGAGKGTQAREIARIYGVPHLSTGDMFRDHVARGTGLGRRAKPVMDAGQLVPDDIVLGMVAERIAQPDCRDGFVFDGFPRTLGQAQQLGKILDRSKFGPPVVLHLGVDHDELARRIGSRRACAKCGAIYNLTVHPPREEGKCDKCGGALVQRADDREEVVRERLAVYDRQTEPLVEYYTRRGELIAVDGARDVDVVRRELLAVLEKLEERPPLRTGQPAAAEE